MWNLRSIISKLRGTAKGFVWKSFSHRRLWSSWLMNSGLFPFRQKKKKLTSDIKYSSRAVNHSQAIIMKLINSHSCRWKVGSLKTLLNPVHSQSANNEFRWAADTPPSNFATWPYIFGLLSFLSKKCGFKRSICCPGLFHFDTWINWPIFMKFDMKNKALETIPNLTPF